MIHAFDLDAYARIADQLLLSMKITHPKTPGLVRYWDCDFQSFDEGYFDEPPKLGNPGLRFNDRNDSSIFDDLKIGYRGTEFSRERELEVARGLSQESDLDT